MYRYSLLFFIFTMLFVSACHDSSTGGSNQTGPEMLVAADGNGDIFTVNPGTGVDDLWIVTMTDNLGAMVALGKVSSMVYVPSLSKWLLGTGGNAFCAGCIQQLDTATGVATTLSTGAGTGDGISGLAINPADEKIYTFQSDSGSGPMWEVDPADGSFTELHANVVKGGSSGNGTTYADGVLYITSGDELYSVDPVTGGSSMIAVLSFTGFPAFAGASQPIGSLTTRASDGAVFGILKDGGGNNNTQVTYLVRVNVTTGEVTNVGANANLLDGLMFVPTAVQTPLSSPAAYFTFDGTAEDQSGAGNDGTLLGGATASSGALILGNNTSDMLTLPGSVMDGFGDFTIAAWLRIDTLRGDNHMVVSGANAIEDNALGVWYREATNEWVLSVNDSSSAFTVDSTIEDGMWHHMTVVRSGNMASMYLDGVQLGTSIVVPGDALDIDNAGLVFGQDQDSVGGGFEANEAWAGAMDNLRIYGHALGNAEILMLSQEAH